MANRNELIREIQSIMPTIKRLMHTRTHELLRQYGISYAQFELIFTLQRCDTGEAPSAKEIAEQLSLTAGAVSQLIDSLVEQGLIERQADSQDRRVTRIVLSSKGLDIAKQIHENKHLLMRDVMESLTEEELVIMLKVQRKIAERLQQNK